MSQTTDRTQSNYARANQSDHRQRNREEMQHGVVAVLDKQREKFQEILPDTVEWSDFRSCFVTAVQRNWRLLEADRESLWLALQDCALAGLRPDGKEAALVIFGDDSQDEEGNRVASTANAKKKVQLLPMVWGLTRLVHNTGLVADIRARCVYKGEHFRHWEEDGLEHYEYRREVDPDFDDDPSKIIGAFAVIQFKDGSFKMDFMSRRQIERRRAVSRAKKGPWGPWYDEQAMKTVLKHVMKGAPKSRELQRISDVLDRDDSLPTIDGEKPVEIQSEAAPTADPVRDAFQGDGRKTGQETSRRTETPPVTERAAPTTTASAPKPPPAAVPVSPIINVAAAWRWDNGSRSREGKSLHHRDQGTDIDRGDEGDERQAGGAGGYAMVENDPAGIVRRGARRRRGAAGFVGIESLIVIEGAAQPRHAGSSR